MADQIGRAHAVADDARQSTSQGLRHHQAESLLQRGQDQNRGLPEFFRESALTHWSMPNDPAWRRRFQRPKKSSCQSGRAAAAQAFSKW